MKLSQMVKEKQNNNDDFSIENDDIDNSEINDDETIDATEKTNEIDDDIDAEIAALAAIGDPNKTPIAQQQDDITDDDDKAELDALKALAGI